MYILYIYYILKVAQYPLVISHPPIGHWPLAACCHSAPQVPSSWAKSSSRRTKRTSRCGVITVKYDVNHPIL